MRAIIIILLLLSAEICKADDITITVTDPDALDAINNIIAANGLNEQPSDIITGMIVPQLVIIRGQQITNAAQATAANDPAVLAFQKRQTSKATQIQPQPSPAQKIQ